jgi:hypothetical protein
LTTSITKACRFSFHPPLCAYLLQTIEERQLRVCGGSAKSSEYVTVAAGKRGLLNPIFLIMCSLVAEYGNCMFGEVLAKLSLLQE